MYVEKKYFYLSTSLFFKLLINLFVVFYIAKNVSVSDFGSFSLAFILASIITLFLDNGFNLKGLVLTSKSKKEINEELSSMIFSKVILTIVAVLALVVFFFLSKYDSDTNLVIAMLSISAIPLSFGNFYLNNFKILNRFDKEAAGFLIQGSIVIILLGINHFYGEKNIIIYAVILLVARLIYMVFGLLSFRKAFFKSFNFKINNALFSIKTATP